MVVVLSRDNQESMDQSQVYPSLRHQEPGARPVSHVKVVDCLFGVVGTWELAKLHGMTAFLQCLDKHGTLC